VTKVRGEEDERGGVGGEEGGGMREREESGQ